MTLKKVAAEADVSISTASQIINKSSKCPTSKEMQDKIWKIVRRTDYAPNTTVKDLKRSSAENTEPLSHPVACLFARASDTEADSFFSSLARSIEKKAFKYDYILKYTFMVFDINHPSTFRLITDNHVDGATVLGRCDKQLLKFLEQYFKCVAYTGLNNLEAEHDQIIYDGYQTSITAINYLIQLEHTKIAYIGEAEAEDRYQGYCTALTSRQLPLQWEYISSMTLSLEGGYKGAAALLDKGCDATAFFCPNNVTAIGAMRATKERGLSVPRNVSVIGIDDIDMAQCLNPMLTAIHVPIEEMEQITTKALIGRIEGGHHLPMKINLPCYIANRESCGPCRRGE